MRQIQTLQQTSTAAVTVANTTSTSTLIPSVTVHAGELALGRRVRMRAWGIYSTASVAPTMKFASRIALSEVVTIAAYLLPASATNWGWVYESEHVTDTITGGSTTLSMGRLTIQTLSTGECAVIHIPRATSTNTFGIARAFDAIMQWGTASTSNTMTVQSSTVESF